MKRTNAWMLIIALLFIRPGAVFGYHEVMNWQNNRSAAVSVTFDDGWYSQPTEARVLLNDRYLKGTFFLTIESLDWTGANWDMWRAVADDGHEVGSHTISHPSLSSLSDNELRDELSGSQDTINQNILTQTCLTLAYPYGDYNEFVETVTSEYYIAGREVWSPGYLNHYPGGDYDPVDFYAVGSFSFDASTHEQILDYLDSLEQHHAWFVVHIHDIDPDSYPDRHSRVEAFLDELLIRDLWVDTFGNIVRYMQEKIDSQLDVVYEGDAGVTLNLIHSLDTEIYNLPLTIRSTVPASWNEVEITQGASIEIVEPIIEDDEFVIYYNVTPNNGLINLLPTTSSETPIIELNPGSLSQSASQGSNAFDQFFSVRNSGSGTLGYSITVDVDWMTCTPENGTSDGELDTITVNYTTSSLGYGTYPAIITINAGGARNTPQEIPVSLSISDPSQSLIELNFEEGSGDIAFDTSGGNNDGIIEGAEFIAASASGAYALQFDGINDQVVCQGSYSLRPDDLSVAIWVRHQGDTASPDYGGIAQGAYGNGYSSGFRLLDYNNGLLAQINFGDSSPVRILGNSLPQDEWVQIVLTYDHEFIKLYENSELTVEIPENRNINWDDTNDLDLYVGWSQWYFQGAIDRFMQFDFALNELEIQALYNETSGACLVDGDCDDGTFCNGAETCTEGVCMQGSPVLCDDGTDCTLDSCNEALAACEYLPDDTQCDDGRFCNGAELCDGSTGCMTGTDPCAGQMCDEESNQCAECLGDIDCDDGVFCNGAEACVDGVCTAGTDPCPGESCDEANAVCTGCLVDGDCDDGIYCNGTETCADGVCQAGVAVSCDDGVVCTIDTCNEITGTCENISDNSVCDDGEFCNGSEICDSALGCVASEDPCVGQMCDEQGDECVDCLGDGDCDDGVFCNGAEACVDGVCTAGTDPCPGESCDEANAVCTGCLVDGDCDDGIYCNGTETCADGVCQAGVAVSCDDGVVCTIDTCNEITGTCENISDNSVCDDGEFCNGSEICDSALGCVASEDPCVGQMCDEQGDECVDCLGDGDCDDGVFCNGAEACVDGVCTAGTDPCPGESCDEANAVCTGCLVDGDCDDGIYCNGTETCADGVCTAGTDPCPEQVCDEVNQSCDTMQSILRLDFEEGEGVSAIDTSGGNNNGMIEGAIYTEDSATGVYALSFDGNNDRIVCQADPLLRPNVFGLVLWVKHQGDTRSPNYGGILQGAYGDGYDHGFRILDYNNTPLVQINIGDSSPIRILGAPFPADGWVHLAVTYDHQSIKLYQNSVLVREMAESRNINWGDMYSLDLTIGWAQWYFNGLIDGIRMFDHALTDIEVLDIYNEN
jgi:peptidoglycan/xylan/chitin deacetylase (PgdA/CDA1 family)